MKKIYIAVFIFLSLSLLLFIASFFYLDKVNHKTFYYLIRTSGRDSGTIKVERFVTENKIIYKSVTSLPFESVYTEYRARLVLDKNYNLESYTKERISGRVTDVLYLENFKNLVSFVSRYESGFACAENIPIRKETFVFEEDSPATYLPIIENYNFSRGRSQGFNAISCFNTWSLPPMKRFITFTSIKDEHLKIDSRKVKTENLLLKIRDYPQGALWVGKSDRAIMKIEVPAKNMTITRAFRPKALKALPRTIRPDGYISKDVSFKSKGADLSSTLTFPSKEGKFPAVLFAPGAGPQDRDYQGLFAGLADHLSRNGLACLRFDKRGVGSSGGDFSSSTGSGDIEDLEAALQYLKGQSMVDPDNLTLIGHGSGAIHAMKIAVKDGGVKGLIMMAPSIYANLDEKGKREELRMMSQKTKWTDDYLNLAIRAAQETQNRVAASNSDWLYILGKKCFLGNMRDDTTDRPPDIAPRPDLAVLILQGKNTDDPAGGAGPALDKMMADAGNSRHMLTYYAYLGQFFGQKINDGAHRNYYDTDKEVLENIRNWLAGITAN